MGMTYDGDNRLTQVVKSGSTTTYAYGPDGSRIKTVATVGSNPATTSYLIGSSELGGASLHEGWKRKDRYFRSKVATRAPSHSR